MALTPGSRSISGSTSATASARRISSYTRTSGVDLGLRVSGQNLNINASLGPAGFAITDGSVIFDKDGLFDDDDGNGVEDNLQNGGQPLVPGAGDTWTGRRLAGRGAGGLRDHPSRTAQRHHGRAATIAALSVANPPIGTYFGPSFSGIIKATLPGAITSDIGSLDLPSPIVITVTDLPKLFSSDPAERKQAVQLDLPDFSDLLPELPGLIQLLRDPAILLDGVDSGLGLISKLMTGKAATKLPLIGDQLRTGSGFIEEFRAGFLAELTAKLRGAGDTLLATMQTGMFDLFGPRRQRPRHPQGLQQTVGVVARRPTWCSLSARPTARSGRKAWTCRIRTR